MIDFWIFPLSTIWGAYQNQGFTNFSQNNWHSPLDSANNKCSITTRTKEEGYEIKRLKENLLNILHTNRVQNLKLISR